ncbi:glutamic-type intramembrane protease PrsW [Aquibacillus koreensis]|uniref:Protease PrsW n=1 Tax=Aquibacillus koreensis TaxID=279446 RepID=A0A9X4AGA0_9BACI|nr:glutamic-type intramembrane protease PrsW [Aquibacillus koreensis]MCT2537406.1 glutamic-type intramembrane protease PrsW [Aquibacillus koreensis]MDC3418852.1 glutamic-type intramembrane protease PrsW [Aquibacillus koreensis]
MFAILSAGIAPTLALMSFFYLKDKFNSEPITAVIKTFFYGALLVFPIMFIQYAFMEEGVGQTALIRSFILTGLLEEFFKWFIFLYTVYKYTEFDSFYDGITYGVSISLGFAAVENILYLFAHGIEYAFSRALFPVSSHALFGVIMGYYLGKARFNESKSKRTLFLALVIPVVLHGTYDFILEAYTSNWMYILIPFMILLWALGLRKVKKANQYRSNDVVVYLDTKKQSEIQ